ncbi:MAG TPA: hypothetical protein VGH79_02160 [Gaiellaceae bacterium]|jgi:hypothetical protein
MAVRVLLAALVAAVVVAPASGGRHSSAPLTPYAGLGTWLDIYATSYWDKPGRQVAAMARDGVKTLYLQTGNYSQQANRNELGRFVDAAHAHGLRVVAWYLPSFAHPEQDARRSLQAIRFRSAHGERFDAFALDIEASLVGSESLRNQRLLSLSRRLRKAVGPTYALGAIIPSPLGIRRHLHYWRSFPYRGLGRIYDVFLPMAYFTDHDLHGIRAVRSYLAADVAIIRNRTGKPHVPVHLIGGISRSMTKADTTGFMRAVADCRPLGYSLYAWSVMRSGMWPKLRGPASDPTGKACTQSGAPAS